MDKKSLISVVTPTYNEKDNIIPFIQNVTGFFASRKIPLEIIVVDDDSPDGTAQLVRQQRKKLSHVKLLVRVGKKGIGSAYFDGFKQAKGAIIIALDADLSQSLDTIPAFLQKIKKGAVMVVGSRYLPGSQVIGVPMFKQVGGQIFNLMLKLFLGFSLIDSTHSYRAFTKKSFHQIVGQMKEVSHPAFFIELTYWMQKSGGNLAEVSCQFRERAEGYSKLNLFSGLRDAVKLLVRLRSY